MRLPNSFLFSVFFPVEKARLARAERIVGRLVDLAGYDEWSDPLLAGIEDQVKAGHEIKAAEMYCKATGAGVGEAKLAVDALRDRVGIS